VVQPRELHAPGVGHEGRSSTGRESARPARKARRRGRAIRRSGDGQGDEGRIHGAPGKSTGPRRAGRRVPRRAAVECERSPRSAAHDRVQTGQRTPGPRPPTRRSIAAAALGRRTIRGRS
jgi:hypothetical protein